ncbi:MAG TPA: DNA polymerase III subunit beta [Chloroflexota bacterium]
MSAMVLAQATAATTVRLRDLKTAMQVLRKAAGHSPLIPELEAVRIEASASGEVRLRAGQTVFIEAVLVADSPTAVHWTPTRVDARLLSQVVDRLEGDVATLGTTESALWVEAGPTRLSLAAWHASDPFPAMAEPGPWMTVALPAGSLAEALRRVLVAVAEDKTRPALTGVLVEVAGTMLRLVASDGARLHYDVCAIDGQAPHESRALVPAEAVDRMIDVLGTVPRGGMTQLHLGERHVRVDAGMFRLRSSLIEASFPKYRSFLDLEPLVHVEFPVRPLEEAVGRLAVLARRSPAIIRFSPGDESNVVRLLHAVADVGNGEEHVPLVSGQWPAGLRVAYQARFLLDILAHAGETIIYEVANPLRYAIWRGPSTAWRAVVMPWRDAGESA